MAAKQKIQKKSCSVIATQFSHEITRKEIEDYFSEVGSVKKCHLVRDKDGIYKGIAYIIYASEEDAAQAVTKLDNTPLQGKVIRVKYSRQRDDENHEQKNFGKTQQSEDGQADEKRRRKNKKYGQYSEQHNSPRKTRHGRIIIRNLSFKADEKVIEDHFAAYGKISEVSILRKKDGKMVGCAFIQYSNKGEALKAIMECNMKPLLGRPIAVDLAVAKERFVPNEVKKESKEEYMNETEIKTEEDIQYISEETIYTDSHQESKDDIKIKEEKLSSEDKGEDESDEYTDDNGVEDDSEELAPVRPKPPPTKEASKDVAEGRTLFIKNLSFDATEEDVAGVLQKFGEVKYVLLCIDRLTEHPRGTAFAQFQEREAADACLAAEADPSTKPEFCLHGRAMHVMRAISRKQLDNRKDEKDQKKTEDKRNLYLAREGFVRPGTQAAVGVSKADMDLRMKRERVKRRMLKNLHIFVSLTRLCINNLTEQTDDKKLMQIFRRYAPDGAEVTEARVMKDLRDIDDNGRAKSRGYGFVNFTCHDHALEALRKVNNNPDVFTNNQRPIVEFSLENRSVLKAREKRMEKSREKNPLWNKDKSSINVKKGASSQVKAVKLSSEDGKDKQTLPNFMGSKSNPAIRDLPSNIGPKIRHEDRGQGKGKISRKQFRKEQRDRALGKKRRRPQQDTPEEGSLPSKKPRGEETESQGKKKKTRNKKKLSKHMQIELKNEKAFSAMVQKYKQKFATGSSAEDKKRWYED